MERFHDFCLALLLCLHWFWSVNMAFLKTKDIVREYRLTLAHKLHRSLDSTFVDLLSGSQRIWLDVYRRHPKVTRAWEAGIIPSVSVIVWFLSLTLCCFLFTKDKALKPHVVIAVGSWRCIFHSINVAWSQGKHVVVANLCQNPRSRPIVSSLCPTLLRQGHMFVLQNPHQQHLHPGFCERALFGKEWQVEFVYMFNVQCSMFYNFDMLCQCQCVIVGAPLHDGHPCICPVCNKHTISDPELWSTLRIYSEAFCGECAWA